MRTENRTLPREAWPQRQLPQSWCTELHVWSGIFLFLWVSHLQNNRWTRWSLKGLSGILSSMLWEAGTHGWETQRNNLSALYCTLSCFSVSSLSNQSIFYCCFCLSVLPSSLVCISFFPCISLPFWPPSHHVPLPPCQVLRWGFHMKHHSEIVIFWDADKLLYRAAFSSWGWGQGHLCPRAWSQASQRFTSTWNPGHVGTSAWWIKAGGEAQKSIPKKLTISL